MKSFKYILIYIFFSCTLHAVAQTYQQYPVSVPKPENTAPKYSIEDSVIIKKYSQQIITRSQITRNGNKVVCDLLMAGSRITGVSRVGSYYKIQVKFRGYTDTFYFKASNYDLAWLRVGMTTEKSQSTKEYAKRIQANQREISHHNDSIRRLKERENRNFISKIIDPQ